MSDRGMRLAKHLLAEYRDASPFEIDMLFEEDSQQLIEALECYGCKVIQTKFSTRLVVICPADGIGLPSKPGRVVEGMPI